MERHEADVKELTDDSERQINRYNELWTAHDNLLMKAQTLRSQVTILSSGGRAEGTSGWFEGVSGWAEGASSQVGGASRQSEGPSNWAEGGNRWSEGSGDRIGSTDS